MLRRTLLAALVAALMGVPAVATSEDDNPLRCEPCTSNCEELGVPHGELYCSGPDMPTRSTVPGVAFEAEPAQGQAQPEARPEEGPGEPAPEPVEPSQGEIENVQVTSAEWRFQPIVEVKETEGDISPARAQQVLNEQADNLVECYDPRTFAATRGQMTVDLYLNYDGTPRGVQGYTAGIAPTQARCILSNTWAYEFPMPETAPDINKVRYEVAFGVDRQLADDINRSRPHLVVENVRVDGDVPRQEVVRTLTEQARSLRRCHVLGMRTHPHDVLVAEVEMDLERRINNFQATDVDITVGNETSERPPNDAQVQCLADEMRRWSLALPPSETTELGTRFFVTFYPAMTEVQSAEIIIDKVDAEPDED